MKPIKPTENINEQKNLGRVAWNNFRRSSVTKKIGAAIGFVATIVIPMLITDKDPLLYTLLILISVCVVYFSYMYAKAHNYRTKNTVIMFLVCLIVIGGLKYALDYYKKQSDPCGNPETLYDYFNCEDSENGKIRIRRVDTITMTNIYTNEVIKIPYEGILNLNFENLTYSYKFYCHSEKYMKEFSVMVPNIVDTMLNEKVYQTNAIPNIMREKADSLNDLTFTKNIYVYLDEVINAEEENWMKEVYEKHTPQLNLKLRTRLYTMYKNHDMKVTPE
jgi:hypothetical protein